MKVSLGNGLPDIEANVKSLEDGGFDLSIKQIKKEPQKTLLGDVKCGSIVKIGNHDYVVLEHIEYRKDGGTLLVSNLPVQFGIFDSYSSYYKTSEIRKYLNDEFYEELCKEVGEYRIIPHEVCLDSMDGSFKDCSMTMDNVSLLSVDLYRKYRQFLRPAPESNWWTLTPVSANDAFTRAICYVDSYGIIRYSLCDKNSRGIKPFFILENSAEVDEILKGEV